MKILFSHPTGNANVRAAGYGLAKATILAEFCTTIAAFPNDWLDRIGIGPLAEISRRQFHSTLKPYTRSWPYWELGRLLASKSGFHQLTKHETGLFSVDAVYQNFDRHVASRLPVAVIQGTTAVYAYEDGAAFSFRQAQKLGIYCLYDLPIGYWRTARQLLEGERERWPAWASTITGLNDSDDKLARKDEELRLADHIFVASQFTAKTLLDFPDKLAPIHIVPYGFPPVGSLKVYRSAENRQPLRLLFVGGLSQRKGIADLFAAVDALGNRVALTVVGYKATENCNALNVALTKHRWIPSLPHDAVLQLMREHDVLVFPSLFEGFGLVITEAMSQGTPVITTNRTAGPDLIEHGRNGWLIEAGSTSALKDAIEALIAQPALIAQTGKAAMETARLRPWSVYGQELVTAIVESSQTSNQKRIG